MKNSLIFIYLIIEFKYLIISFGFLDLISSLPRGRKVLNTRLADGAVAKMNPSYEVV